MKIKKINNLILISLVAFFIVSVFYLFWSAERPLQEKWWAVHFEDFKGDNLNFVLENHSGKQDFSYLVFLGEEKKAQESFGCEEEECLVEIENKNYQGRILIQVLEGEEKKEIYKNL